MKFDVIIGNPPYQEETAKKETKNGQKSVKNIFQYFQEQSEQVANDYTVLIYPGGRWIHQAGKGLHEFGLKQINDQHLKELVFYPNANEVFAEAGISDGISIVFKNLHKTTAGFKYVYTENGVERTFNVGNPGENLLPLNPDDIEIIHKIDLCVTRKNFEYLHDRILPRSLFGIESNFVEEHPDEVRVYRDCDSFNPKTEIKLFTNDKAGKMGRATWFVANKDIIKNNASYINEWQVVVSSANAGGQKRDNQIAIIDNHSAFGRSRVALKSFKSEKEAHNFLKYANCYLIRYAFLMTDESLSSLAKWVPDILNYSDNNGFVDFSKNVDVQLNKLFDLTPNEVDYIETKVNNQRKNRGE